MRASVSSRPRAATDSKIPGETVVPLIATRIGWKTSLRLDPEPLHHAAQRRLDRLGRRTARPRPAPRAPRAAARARRRAITFAQAFSSDSAGRSTRKPASGQKSASVCIFSWAIATASRGPSRPSASSSRRASSVGRQLAQVAAVHPAQLLLVEDRRRSSTPASSEKPSISSLGGHERGRLVVAPAEQRDVVAHGLGQVAALAQLLHRRRAVALGELLAVGAVQQRQVGVDAAARRPAPAASSPGAGCSRGGPRRARRG